MEKYNNNSIQFIKKGKNNNASTFLIGITKAGELIFAVAKQKGEKEGHPTFDYENKAVFYLSITEKARLIQFLKGKENGEIKFPHLISKKPKNINFKRENEKVLLNIYLNNTKEAFNYSFNSEEIMILVMNLMDSLSLYKVHAIRKEK